MLFINTASSAVSAVMSISSSSAYKVNMYASSDASPIIANNRNSVDLKDVPAQHFLNCRMPQCPPGAYLILGTGRFKYSYLFDICPPAVVLRSTTDSSAILGFAIGNSVLSPMTWLLKWRFFRDAQFSSWPGQASSCPVQQQPSAWKLQKTFNSSMKSWVLISGTSCAGIIGFLSMGQVPC